MLTGTSSPFFGFGRISGGEVSRASEGIRRRRTWASIDGVPAVTLCGRMERTKDHHPAKLAVAEDLFLIGLAFLAFASCGGVMAHLAGLSVERRLKLVEHVISPRGGITSSRRSTPPELAAVTAATTVAARAMLSFAGNTLARPCGARAGA
jgi:hypothetical protein